MWLDHEYTLRHQQGTGAAAPWYSSFWRWKNASIWKALCPNRESSQAKCPSASLLHWNLWLGLIGKGTTVGGRKREWNKTIRFSAHWQITEFGRLILAIRACQFLEAGTARRTLSQIVPYILYFGVSNGEKRSLNSISINCINAGWSLYMFVARTADNSNDLITSNSTRRRVRDTVINRRYSARHCIPWWPNVQQHKQAVSVAHRKGSSVLRDRILGGLCMAIYKNGRGLTARVSLTYHSAATAHSLL